MRVAWAIMVIEPNIQDTKRSETKTTTPPQSVLRKALSWGTPKNKRTTEGDHEKFERDIFMPNPQGTMKETNQRNTEYPEEAFVPMLSRA